MNRYFGGGCHGSLGEKGRWNHSELLRPLDMLVDLVACTLTLAGEEIVLDHSNDAAHESEAPLAIATVAILADFADAAPDSDRAAKSPLRMHSRLAGTALFGTNECFLVNEGLGVDVAHFEVEPVAGKAENYWNKRSPAVDSGALVSAVDRQLCGPERLGERAEARQKTKTLTSRKGEKEKKSYLNSSW